MKALSDMGLKATKLHFIRKNSHRKTKAMAEHAEAMGY